GQGRRVLDRISVRVPLAPSPCRIVVFQREAERINAGMAIGAGRVAFVLFQLGFQRQAAEKFVVGRQRSRVGGRRRRRGTQDAAQNPVTSLHRTRAQRRGSHRQQSSQAEQSAALERARALNQFRTLSGLDIFLDTVELGQVFIQKSVVGEQDFTDG